MHKCVSEFLTSVCSQIESKDLREAVRTELASHLIDKTDSFCAEGLEEDEAAQKAVEAMGAPSEIGKRLAEAYKPDYKACFGGIILFFASIALSISMIRVTTFVFADFPSFLLTLVGGVALALIGGYKNVSTEEMLARFSKTVIYSGFAGCLIGGIGILCSLTEVEYLGPNLAVMLLSLFYGVIFSILSLALIPLTPTARLRKKHISETLSIE